MSSSSIELSRFDEDPSDLIPPVTNVLCLNSFETACSLFELQYNASNMELWELGSDSEESI